MRLRSHDLSLEVAGAEPAVTGVNNSADPFRKLRKQAEALGSAPCYLVVDFDDQ